MSHKTNNISILQFNETLIARMRTRRSDKAVEVLAYDMEKGAWSAEDGSLGEALKAFAAKHNLAEDHVFTVLPRHDMTARILELPSQDLAEIASMIRLSAEEYVPFPADELIIDQHMLQKTTDGQSKALVVFAHKDVVESHLALLRTSEIEAEQVFLSTACLASAALAAPSPKHPRYALVNLAPGGLEVIVINGKRLEYGRAVASTQDWAATAPDGNAGLADLPVPGEESFARDGSSEAIEELRVEVRASLSAYRRESEDGEGVEGVYFCSNWADVSPYCTGLQQEMAEECAPATFAQNLIAHAPENLSGIPLVALGAALLAQGRGEIGIRLLPKSVLSERERTGVKQKALRIGGLAAIVLVALTMLYAQAIHQRNAYLNYLRARIAAVEPTAKSVRSKEKQLRILQNQVNRSDSVVELLAELCNLYPASDMNITHFIFSHDEKIEVFGRAKSLSLVDKLVQDLTDAGKSSIPLFARAETIYDNKGIERGQEVRDFALQIPFPQSGTSRDEVTDVDE